MWATRATSQLKPFFSYRLLSKNRNYNIIILHVVLVYYSKEWIWTETTSEQGAEENIWTQKKWNNMRLEKAA
jgi:hypothetical protein